MTTSATPSTALAVSESRSKLARTLELAVEELSERDARELLTTGNLGVLAPAVQTAYYAYRCKQMGLDPLSRPFDMLALNGKVVLYANRNCAEQLAAKHGISIYKHDLSETPDAITIFVYGRTPDGRESVNCASVDTGKLKGADLATARMKCMTKAQRRLILAMTGGGMLDETEVETIPGARRMPANGVRAIKSDFDDVVTVDAEPIMLAKNLD